MPCLAVPAGPEEFFLEGGDPLGEPHVAAAQARRGRKMEERIKKIRALAPKYRTELLAP